MKAAIRGTEIYFDVSGMEVTPVKNSFEKRPILFMLHGGPGGDHTRFKQHSLELQDVAQLVFIDHRGCGRSQKVKSSEYTIDNNIEDIEALRLHLGLETISVLGTSYGGMVAQGYAIRYSQHVDKLILVATAPSYHFMEEAKKYLSLHASPEQIALSERLFNGSFKNSQQLNNFFEIMEPLYSVNPANFPLPKNNTKWNVQALNKGFREELSQFNFLPDLKKITSKTLILAGENDWICRPNQARLINQHIPDSKLIILNNCGHSIAVDAHKPYIEEIKRFLLSFV